MQHEPGPRRPHRAIADERGAIIVMGVFMCIFLVGGLWYIAGVGDAIVYRERMQEASDAVAFSTAVLEARGMNILVLINLLMAAILGVLVALNLAIFAVLATAAVLFGIGTALEWFGGAGTPFLVASGDLTLFEKETLQPLHDNVVKPLVTDALEALHDVEQGIPTAVPPVAQAAAFEINALYGPTVNPYVSTATIFMSGGAPVAGVRLPVKPGTTHTLCMKSFDAVKGALDSVLNGLDIMVSPIEAVANAVNASDFFCELGGGGKAPDVSAQLSSIGQSQCDSNKTITDACNKARDERSNVSRLQQACSGWSPDADPPTTPPDPDCPGIPQLDATATADQDTCDSAKQTCSDTNKSKSSGPPPSNSTPSQGGGGSTGKEPAAVDHDNWWNGSDKAQILAVTYSDGKSVTYSPKFVAIASQGGVKMPDPSTLNGNLTSASQAEFFYDCPGKWDDCDKDEEAMWNFHWRARFRLVNPGVFGFFVPSVPIYAPEAVVSAKLATQAAHDAAHPRWSDASPASLQFAWDVKNLFPPMSMALH